jgi:hypothetical protein
MGGRKKEIVLAEERTDGELQRCHVFVKKAISRVSYVEASG